MKAAENRRIPKAMREDVDRAAHLLKEAGCSEVFIFGSAATGDVSAGSDLDVAIRGCPRGRFFELLGRLIRELRHPVDLVNLDAADPFARRLEEEGELVRVA